MGQKTIFSSKARGDFQFLDKNGKQIGRMIVEVEYEIDELPNLQKSYLPLLWTTVIDHTEKFNLIYSVKSINLISHKKL